MTWLLNIIQTPNKHFSKFLNLAYPINVIAFKFMLVIKSIFKTRHLLDVNLSVLHHITRSSIYVLKPKAFKNYL